MGMNINSMSAIGSAVAFDSEYHRIIRELRALGIEPSGDKTTDKAKLQAAKEQQRAQNNGCIIIEAVTGVNETEKAGAISSADNIKNDNIVQTQNMQGAEQIAQLNKFRILGLY